MANLLRGWLRPSWLAAALFAFLPILFAAPAVAAVQKYDDHPACDGENVDPERRIVACTQIIEDRSESSSNRSIALVIRGNAYGLRGDYTRAISDYDRAIDFDPTNTAAS
ncbi:MAG: tetratricopeptide repeat protein, partial [Mesorhizobium sp.]|nr:tetratricopeptide repeat protein [Mesorhizobium sp.]